MLVRKMELEKQAIATFALIGMTWALLVGLMFFGNGSGEHDTFMMAAGIVHGVMIDQVINSMNYADDLQFMFYYALHFLAQSLVLDARAVLFAMNLIGAFSALLIPFALFFLLRPGSASAKVSPGVAALLLITSPTYAFIVPYGHPFHVAIAISLSSMLVFRRFVRDVQPSRKYVLFGAAILLQTIALMIRVEQVFLLWFCLIGLLIYEQEKSKENWFWLFALFAFSSLVFAAAHYFMVTAARDATASVSSAPTAASIYDVMKELYRLTVDIYFKGDFRRAIEYHAMDIGVPLLAIAGIFLVKQFMEKNYRLMLALLVSVGPSLLVYFVNTSPPRHFFITVIALAIYVGASAKRIESLRLVPIAVFIFTLNVLIPPVLDVVHGVEGKRRNFTYSFFERNDRNKEQTRAAMQFFPDLLSRVPSETVIFGKWIHIAQISMIMSNERDLRFAPIELLPSIEGFVVSYQGRRIYLIVMPNEKDVQLVVASAKKLHPKMHFLSLRPGSSTNDFGTLVPSEIDWWSVHGG